MAEQVLEKKALGFDESCVYIGGLVDQQCMDWISRPSRWDVGDISYEKIWTGSLQNVQDGSIQRSIK